MTSNELWQKSGLDRGEVARAANEGDELARDVMRTWGAWVIAPHSLLEGYFIDAVDKYKERQNAN